MLTNKELIETAKQAMRDLWEVNNGKLLDYEQTIYNCLRLFCERLKAQDAINDDSIEVQQYVNDNVKF